MKKVIFLISLTLFGTVSVLALKSDFNINTNKLFDNNRTSELTNNFSYKIDYNNKKDENKKLEDLSLKITYLILGDGDLSDESPTSYLERKKEYLSYMYNPKLPKLENGDMDTNSNIYKDSVVAGINVPGMFSLMNEHNVRYSTLGNVSVTKSDNKYISRVVIENVTMDMTDETNPRKYKQVNTNLIMYYLFIEYNDEYKLYYLFGETEDELADYLKQSRQNENKGINKINVIDSSLNQLYDFTKLNKLTNKDLNYIYNKNINNILLLNTYKGNSIVGSASGFMLNDSIGVTTWTYIKDSLTKGELITVNNYKGNTYKLDGIITINEDADIALLKVSGYKGNGVILGNTNMDKEDPVIVLGTKSGMGVSTSTGIIINNSSNIQSLIPITYSDQGSPLINSKGEVIGINTSKSINSSVSYANKIDSLVKAKKELNKDTKYTTFDKLKENYYYNHNNDEVIKNTLSKKEWNKYKDIGSLDQVIFLPLVKASKKDKILSLRYKNDIPNLVSNSSLINTYVNKLKQNGYKITLDNNNKKILNLGNNEIIIRSEFNYIIIVMVIE